MQRDGPSDRKVPDRRALRSAATPARGNRAGLRDRGRLALFLQSVRGDLRTLAAYPAAILLFAGLPVIGVLVLSSIAVLNMRWDWLVACLVLILLFAALPMICSLISSTIATALGARLDHSGSYPTPFLGIDIGKLLYGLSLMHWVFLILIPVYAVMLAIWLVAAIALIGERLLAV